MAGPSRVLVAGVDITRDPDVLLERGAEQLRDLSAAIDEWERSSDLHLIPVVSPQLDSIEFRLRMSYPPPLERWSILLGEAVHSFRSAMDGLAFQLTHLDGQAPAEPTKVYFPVTYKARDWKDKAKYLVSMPPEILDRIRALQPFVTHLPPARSELSAIHELDLLPKHRRLIRATTHVLPTDLGIEIQFAATEVRGTYVPLPLASLENDALAANIRFEVPLKSVRTRPVHNVPFLLAADAGGVVNVGTILAKSATSIRAQFDFIYTGIEGPPFD